MVKKIDFHIHTIPDEQKDNLFSFSMKWLKEYTAKNEIDAIAITNHNLFDEENFNLIKQQLSPIKVFPGIELSLNTGHVNVVANNDSYGLEVIKNIAMQAVELDSRGGLSIDQYLQIEGIKDLIYIFEYGKSKELEIPTDLKDVTATFGVANSMKFSRFRHQFPEKVPVLFSDAHATYEDKDSSRNDLDKLSSKQTFVQVDAPSFAEIKSCLSNPQKVSLNKEFLKDVVSVNGVNVSTGLNLIVGKRGTGKTFFINSIEKSNIGTTDHIRQFETSKQDEFLSNKKKEKGDRAFNEKWVQKYSVTLESIRNWLQEDIDNSDFDNYLSELVDFAKNIQQQKTANSIKLFKEPLYSDIDLAGIEFSLKNLNKVIDDEPLWTKFTEKTSGYKKHVISVYNEARKKYIETYKIQKIQKEANSIISAIKSIVQNKTGATQPPEADFGKVIKQQKVEEAINKSVTKMVQPQEIERENILGYSIVVKIRQFSGAKEFKNDAKITEAVKDDVFGAYESNDYVTFLRNLRTKQSFRIGNLHQYFVHTCIQLLTPENIPASGGQSTAFALILRLEEAKNKEIILIDEPEASLDNAFIKEELIQKIQDLKNNSTVFVITHNSTLGALINPDYLIVAKYDKNKEYQILSGEFDSKRITDKDGNTMNSYNDFVEAMEAGFTTYEEKGSQYESLR